MLHDDDSMCVCDMCDMCKRKIINNVSMMMMVAACCTAFVPNTLSVVMVTVMATVAWRVCMHAAAAAISYFLCLPATTSLLLTALFTLWWWKHGCIRLPAMLLLLLNAAHSCYAYLSSPLPARLSARTSTTCIYHTIYICRALCVISSVDDDMLVFILGNGKRHVWAVAEMCCT